MVKVTPLWKNADWRIMREKLAIDSESIKEILKQLDAIGTPQAQQTDDYKHLKAAIENLGALKALLDNQYQQMVRMEQEDSA
jgi:hypothetical protein